MTSKNKISSSTFFGARITSIISSSLVLFLLGILVVMSLITKELSSYVKENIGFSVILSDRISESEMNKLEQKINTANYVKSTDVFTKERALKELAEELGEDPKKFMGNVPLMASIDVKLKSDYANNDSIAQIEKELRANKYVREVVYRKDLIQMVNDNMSRIGFVLLTVALVLMLISVVLLNNTIRLHIYSKRFLLRTMKLVGATHGFIRRPFIISNIYNGILAAFIAIGLLSGVLYFLANEIDGLGALISAQSLLISFGVVLILGILLSFLITYFSLTRFLRMKKENLYSI
ncbi:MAG: permease-like cell division protein FtsX [Bacteroidales bacterium]|nr:permease-like cell division protein FtsX [Bacteroidales bacterium]